MKEKNTLGTKRLQAFFDAGTFVELGAYICRPGKEDAEGVTCGYGAVQGRLVFAFAQDSTLMKGALDGRHADKIVATYEKAMSVGAPVIGFFDCAGAAVFDGAAALAGYGKLLRAATVASGKIPQIAVICGNCGGTMAAVTALFDLTVMVEEQGRLYVSSPSLVGEEVGTAAYAMANGNAALSVASEREANAAVWNLLSYLPDHVGGATPTTQTDDLNRALAIGERITAKDAVAACVDLGRFAELYAGYAENVTAGLAAMGGISSVVIGVDGKLTVDAVLKMTRLASFANAFGLSLVNFVNCEGIAAEDQPRMAGALADLARVMSVGKAPRVCAIVGSAVGAGFLFGGAKTLGTDVVFALPGAQIAALSASAGVAFLWTDRITPEVSRESLEEEWVKTVAAPEFAAAVGEVDDIVAPAELRARVLAALMMLRDKGSLGYRRRAVKPF